MLHPHMDYEHDIFISYRRHQETRAWIDEHFLPLLELRVGLELGRRPGVFIDTAIESGSSWPVALGSALGRSRVLVALWTKSYLASAWCAQELALMLEREAREGLRTTARPHGLVIPAFIHDGESFPLALAHIQHFEIQHCFNVRMARNSPRAEQLDQALGEQAAAIAACIAHAPAWNQAWPRHAAAQLVAQFHQQVPAEQQAVPRFTA